MNNPNSYHKVFSNFASAPFTLDGRQWPTAEHYYQAQKFITTDPDYAEQIRQAPTAKHAAILGRSRQKPLRPDWVAVRETVMLTALLAKFDQNPKAAKCLVGTGSSAVVVPGKDSYWDHPGQNRLGQRLMDVRTWRNGVVPAHWWPGRQVLGAGGYAVVYNVQGLALKVGRISPEEVQAQRYFATQGLALPVLGWRPQVQDLPASVQREVCPVHGLRREILPEGHAPCSCDELPAALLMPQADLDSPIDPDDLRSFMMGFSRDAERELGLIWDARPANIARYQGHLVALDFGEES